MDDYTKNIISNTNYLSPQRYISGRIVEYDMRSANISVLRQKGIIDQNLYARLSSLDKRSREIEVGLIEKNDPEIYTRLAEGIREYRYRFCENNNIDGIQIVRVANDAIYVNTSVDLPILYFDDYIEFRVKSISNVMINLNKCLVFISFVNDDIKLDVIGISNDKYEQHSNYMLTAIATTAYYVERSTTADALTYLSDLIQNYVNLNLDVNYYREFNSDSLFTINVRGDKMGLMQVDEKYKEYLNIEYNLYILRELWSIVLELYNRGR